jgi:hypothetical protein
MSQLEVLEMTFIQVIEDGSIDEIKKFPKSDLHNHGFWKEILPT